MPGEVGLCARVVIREILDDHRPALLESSSCKAARITRFWNAGSFGGPKGRPSSNGTQSARGGLVFSVCGRIRLIATVGMPSSSR